jgi:hypothetical protein
VRGELLQFPRSEHRLTRRRIVLDAIDGLARQTRILGYFGDSLGLQCVPHGIELSAIKAWFAAKVGAIIISLGVLDTSPLSGARSAINVSTLGASGASSTDCGHDYRCDPACGLF